MWIDKLIYNGIDKSLVAMTIMPSSRLEGI